MSGTMIAALLAAVLVGPEAESRRYVVQIDHTTVRFVEGEPEPEARLLCRLEVVSSADGSFDSRTRIGPETTELSGAIADAEDGQHGVDVEYAYFVEQGAAVDVVYMQTSAELSVGESVVIGGLMTKTTDTIEGVTRTQVKRDSVILTVRRQAARRN
jgi:hypothetical protein